MGPILDEQPTIIPPKSRNGLIAFLLSLGLPGLGQVYSGQPKKAAIFFGLTLFLVFLFGITRAPTHFYGLLFLVLIDVALRVCIAIDAMLQAKKQKNYVLKPYNTWYYHLLIAGGMLAILTVFDTKSILGLESFKIPTDSNSPTMLAGDCIMADIKAYKNSKPDYGDLVVYTNSTGQNGSFRVVGLPNDHIELIDNIVRINGKLSEKSIEKSTEKSNNEVKFTDKTASESSPVFVFEEELPNGHRHLIYKNKQPNDPTKTNIKNIVVPPNCYYLLGDNRDNALDSRYEGAISLDSIKGRVCYSYWGKTGIERINIAF